MARRWSLIAGAISVSPPAGVELVQVETATEMRDADLCGGGGRRTRW